MLNLDFRNLLVLVSLAIHAALIFVLYSYGRKTPGGKAYSVAVLSIAAWVFPMFLYRSNLFGQVVLWVRLLYVMASFTSTSFLVFTFVFPNDTRVPRWLEALLVIENIFIIFLCFHPTWFIRGVELVPGSEAVILWGPLYIVYAMHISGFLSAGMGILYYKMHHSEGVVRKQVGYILVGYLFASSLAMMTNLILPWFGYFEFNWLGQLFSTFVAAFSTFAILRYNLLYIKLIAVEGFIIILNLFLAIQLLVSDSQTIFFINALVSLVVLIFSILLIRSIRKEINQRERLEEMTTELQAANIRLQALDKQKTDFLSIAAHQLRTPLSISNGYIELLSDGAYGKVTPETKEILHNMDEGNQRLVKLVDEFLDITRIEQGRVKFDFKPCQINVIIESVLAELKDRAKKSEIVFNVQVDELPAIIIDDEKIRHVVFNYIENTIKYAPGKEVVTVTAREENGGLTVRVQDEGVGFDKVDEANFFQKFYRGNNVKGTNVNGTGLGLYVCRKFVEAHNGKVWAKSPGLGQGSEFGFWLPYHHETGL